MKKNMLVGGLVLSIALLGTPNVAANEGASKEPVFCFAAKQAIKIALFAPLVYKTFQLADQKLPGKDPQSETLKLYLKAITAGILFKSFEDTCKAFGRGLDSAVDAVVAPVAHALCGVESAE